MLESVFHILKISVAIAISATFLIAINTLIGLLVISVSHTIVGEIFALISMYLPFNAGTFFSSLLVVCTGILAFKVAKKIFDLTSWTVSSV